MKRVFKFISLAMILGMMGNSVAMAAAGDSIGSGTINLHGVIRDVTCSINFPNKDLNFNIDLSTLKAAKENQVLETVKNDFTLNNCDGKNVLLTFNSPSFDKGTLNIFPSGLKYETSPLGMYLTLSSLDNNIFYKTAANAIGTAYNGGPLTADGAHGIVLSPKGDSSTFTTVNKFKAGTSTATSRAEAKTYDFVYTYDLTYF